MTAACPFPRRAISCPSKTSRAPQTPRWLQESAAVGCGPLDPFLPYPYVRWLDYIVTVVTVCLKKSCYFLRAKPLPRSILGDFHLECVLLQKVPRASFETIIPGALPPPSSLPLPPASWKILASKPQLLHGWTREAVTSAPPGCSIGTSENGEGAAFP